MPQGPKKRKNSFFEEGGENNNPHTVISGSQVADESVGFKHRDLYAGLGSASNPLGPDGRNAEQEYLMQNMIKGAMFDAAQIATRFNVGIAVRGTGLLAHMGIESGNPTKAQEFKNKTSKEVDIFLCDELEWASIGAVVHYDPRVGWSSRQASFWRGSPKASEEEWEAKKNYIVRSRMPKLQAAGLKNRITWPVAKNHWDALRKMFFSRVSEYHAEDKEYRKSSGAYYKHVHLEGPYIRLKDRPDVNMYGDHDLFCFTKGGYGEMVHDSKMNLVQVQKALQDASNFQAQHGGIWNWSPSTPFFVGIKSAIMGGHSPNDGEPLVYIRPNNEITAAFFIPGTPDRLVSAWSVYPHATKWLYQTYSGKKILGGLKKGNMSRAGGGPKKTNLSRG